jgi:AcrR family transcriptional regulator
MNTVASPPSLAKPALRARGRATLERLLDAAETLLRRGGPDAATVPAIAERAGVSVGNVYKRFPDKDALLRAVYERFFTRALEQNRAVLEPATWSGVPTDAMLHTIVTGMVAGYRRHRALLRGLLLYAETHPDPAFRRRADTLRNETVSRLAALLLARRRDVTHSDPAGAVGLALCVVALALQGLVLSERDLADELGMPGDKLSDELAAMVAGYLGVTRRAPRPSRGTAARGRRR